MATSALWLSEQMALESDRRLMADQKSSRLVEQLLDDVKRLKEENQVLSEQFYNFVHEEHVSKLDDFWFYRLCVLSHEIFETLSFENHFDKTNL